MWSSPGNADGRLQVVDMHRIFSDPKADVVGLANDLASANTPARHPDRETVGMMVAARDFVHVLQLAQRRPPELAIPHDQRGIEKPSLLEILD